MSTSRIASAILDWLEEQKSSLSGDKQEELAMCQDALASVFGVSVGSSRGVLASWSAGSSEASAPADGGGDDMPSLVSVPASSPPASPEAEASAEALKAQGNAALEKGDVRAAEELYSSAIALAPEAKNSHIYFSNRAMARLKLNDAAGSAEDARAAVRLSPGYAKGWSRLGAACQQLGQLEEAESALERSLELDPGSALVKENLADVRRRRGGGSGGGGGAGGGAGAGGLPGGLGDLAPLLSDPELMGIMSSCMSNPAALMQHMGNPKVAKIFAAM
jgi:tetratricopeptide (TPR) repeat protein